MTATQVAVRRMWFLAGATAAGVVFAAVHYTPLAWVTMPATVVVPLLVVAAVTAGAARLGRPRVLAGTGGLLLLAGLVRLATYGYNSGVIGGTSSTAALLAALGVAHLGVLLAAITATTAADD
jgi:hypothetical protein